MVVGVLLLIVAAVAWLYFLWSRRRFYMCALKMKGPWGYPFIGIMHKLNKLEDILYVLPKYAREYKQKSYFTWAGPFPAIYTMDPNVAEVVLHSPVCLNKGFLYTGLDDALGPGLLTSKFPKWINHRKLLNPSFGHKVLLGFTPTFNNFARFFCGQLENQVGCGEVDVDELGLKTALKSSLTASMGITVEEGTNSKIVESFNRYLEIIIYRTVRPWLSNKTIYSYTSTYKSFKEVHTCITNFIQDFIQSKLKTSENNNSSKDSEENEKVSRIFIDQAIRNHQQNDWTIQDVVDETNIIMIASYETTGRALHSTLMFLAMYPQFQERAYEEISTLYHEKEFEVTNNDFQNLVYLEMCINETLRLAPSIPIIGRVCGEDLRISEDITVPAGGEIYIDIFNIHRDEDIWGPTAKTYDPDHFLPSNLQDKHKCAFMPFSKGKRNCIGWQYARMFLRVVLTHVIRKYKFSTTFRYEDMKFVQHISLRYVNTPRLEVQRR